MTTPNLTPPGPCLRSAQRPCRASRLSAVALTASALTVAAGCGGADRTSLQTIDTGLRAAEPSAPSTPPAAAAEPSRPANELPAPMAEAPAPLYAVMYEVYDDVGSTSYLSLLDSLEIEAIDVTRAREYGGGRAFVQSYAGWLFVGDAASPTVTRYSMAEDGSLVTEDSISFANYGLQTGQFDAWNATFISTEKAYLFDFQQGTTIIWNPSTMEIVGEITPPDELHREGLSLEGSPAILRDGLLFRTFNWVNYDDASYSTDFLLASYDVATDTLLSLVPETRCPVPGNLVHRDETGNIYFSNWIWPVAGTLMRGAPASCVLRIPPDGTGFDPEWSLRYTDLAEGRQGAMFTYLRDGRALFSAFHHERTTFDAETDPWSYVGSNNWRLWATELGSDTAVPVEGLDFNGGAFTPLLFDERLFVMVPGGAEDGYATQLFEIDGGRATPRAKLPGWSYQLVKLR